MSEYWIINLASLSIPLLSSFHPKLKFYHRWKYWIPAIILTALVFLVWDAWFTSAGVWWFSEQYTGNSHFLKMPAEEWAFFFCIPYACIFTYETLEKTWPVLKIRPSLLRIMGVAFIAFWLVSLVFNLGRMYTMICYGSAIAVLWVVWYSYPDILNRFIPVFLILLIPFIAVNGLLTGSFSAMEIVSYNDMQNSGIRFLRIPVEDFTYAFSLILMNLMFIRFFEELITDK